MSERLRFPADHVVGALQDYPRPTLDDVRQALVWRVRTLARIIDLRSRLGQPHGRELRELAAIVALVEMAEQLGAGAELIGAPAAADGNASTPPLGWSDDEEADDAEAMADIVLPGPGGSVTLLVDHPRGDLRWELPRPRAEQLIASMRARLDGRTR